MDADRSHARIVNQPTGGFAGRNQAGELFEVAGTLANRDATWRLQPDAKAWVMVVAEARDSGARRPAGPGLEPWLEPAGPGLEPSLNPPALDDNLVTQ